MDTIACVSTPHDTIARFLYVLATHLTFLGFNFDSNFDVA